MWERLSFDDWALALCDTVALRADCRRRKIGSVALKDNRVVGAGYAGSFAGGPSCLAGECPRAFSTAKSGEGYGETLCFSNHAEVNCIMTVGFERCKGSVLYCNAEPCQQCWSLIKNCGVGRVVYKNGKGEKVSIEL